MARHGEKIRKRKDGRWEGRYKIGNDENGRTMYASVYGKSYAETKEKLKVAETIKYKSMHKNNKMMFSYAVEQWYENQKIKLKKATAHKYKYLIERHIIPSLGTARLDSLNSNVINEFAGRKLENGSLDGKKGLSKSYVRTMMLIISSVMKYAAEEGWCMPLTSKIYKPTPEQKELLILSENEQAILERNLIQNLSFTAIGILITLQTGLRIGEICALTWDDFDFDNRVLYVRSTVSRINNPDGKGTILVIDSAKTEASVRAIPFSNILSDLLLSIREKSISKYVVSERKEFISPRTFEYRYHRLMTQFNLPNINYHALRHTFATRCIEYGVDVKSLSEILGHSNVSITLNTYVHSSMNLKRAQIEKLPALSA